MSLARALAPYKARRFIASALDDLRTLPARLSRSDGLSEPWSVMHNSGGGDYIARGEALFSHVDAVIGLGPQHRVLDIGCGGGALADALRRRGRPGEGAYTGFDPARGAIAQCRRRFSKLRADFRFEWADIRNGDYAPRGAAAAEEYRFPCADEAADRIFAGSVFTHLSAAASRAYLAEIGRCLAEEGAAFVSFYILDATGRAALASGAARAKFTTPALGGWALLPEAPEAAIAHEEANVLAWIEAAGLTISQRLDGTWRSAEGSPTNQDVLALRRGRQT